MRILETAEIEGIFDDADFGERFQGVLGQMLRVEVCVIAKNKTKEQFHFVRAETLTSSVFDWDDLGHEPAASTTCYRCENAAEVHALMLDFMKAQITDDRP